MVQNTKKDKEVDDVWDGRLGSAFDVEIDLPTATTEINVNVTNTGNKDSFAIVGITFEW